MAANDLTTLAYVQAYMQDTGAALAAALPALITSASSFFEDVCSRDFITKTYTDDFNGSGNFRLLLRQTPVTAVASVSICGRSIPAASGSNPGYKFDQYGLWLRGWVFPKTIKEITVTWTAGYGAGAANMPLDLQQAIAEMCNVKYKRMPMADKTSISMLGDQTTAFVATELTPFVKQVLSNYKPPFLAPP